MTKHKFTDEEIKKALECCWTTNTCEGCPRIVEANCLICLERDALDLINRYEAEIERLQKANERFEKEFDSYYARVKSEAIKEFENLIINNLIEQAYGRDYLLCLIKEWAKEMTEATE